MQRGADPQRTSVRKTVDFHLMFLLKKKNDDYFIFCYISLCVYVYVSTVAGGGQKGLLGTLKLELDSTVSAEGQRVFEFCRWL